jgi:monovalent cation/hydrogen antiporter
VALLVVVATLIGQGLTLVPLIHRLGVAGDADVQADARRLHGIAAEAGLEQVGRAEDVPEPVREAVRSQYQSRLDYRRRVLDLVDHDDGGEHTDRKLRDLLTRATEAEREAG